MHALQSFLHAPASCQISQSRQRQASGHLLLPHARSQLRQLCVWILVEPPAWGST